jgi:hypothetical protein
LHTGTRHRNHCPPFRPVQGGSQLIGRAGTTDLIADKTEVISPTGAVMADFIATDRSEMLVAATNSFLFFTRENVWNLKITTYLFSLKNLLIV